MRRGLQIRYHSVIPAQLGRLKLKPQRRGNKFKKLITQAPLARTVDLLPALPGRGSPPRINARGLTDTISYRGSRAVGAVEIETSTSRRLPNAIDNVRHRTLFVRRRSAIGRKIGGIPKGGKKTAPNGCLRQLVAFSLIWCAFAYFRRIAKVSARRAGET